MSRSKQTLAIAIVTILAGLCATPARAQVWTKLNAGNPVDAGQPVFDGGFAFDAVETASGDLLYLVQTDPTGQTLGRLTASGAKAWEYFTPNGWSQAGDLVAGAVNHPLVVSSDVAAMRHPDDPEGLFGINTVSVRTGRVDAFWNVHTYPNSFEFTNGEWLTWNAPGRL